MKKLTKLLFKIHSIAGLFTGLLLLLIALSGVALLFEHELEPVFYSRLWKVEQTGKPLPLDTVYAYALNAYPGVSGLRFRTLPEEPDRSIELSMDRPMRDGTWEWVTAYANPYTGDMMGVREARNSFSASIFGWLLRLHYSLPGGKTGEWVVGIVAIIFSISIFTGLVVYRKHLLKVLLFRDRINTKNRRTTMSSLHRVVGVWALLFNLIIGISAAQMMWYVFELDFYAKEKPEAHPRSAPLAQSLEAMKARLLQQHPQFVIRGISINQNEEPAYTFTGRLATDNVLYGTWNAEVVFNAKGAYVESSLPANKSGKETTIMVLQTLHFGQWGGILIKLLYALLGLAPALLSLTGFYLWLRRKKPRLFNRRHMHALSIKR